MQNSKLNGLKLFETIDITKLDKLIQSDYLHIVPWINPQTGLKVCYDNEKAHLLAIRKKIKSNKLEVLYKSSKIGYGRVYPQKSLSLCSIRRQLRHTLAKDEYVDVDIDNAHPVILMQLCEKNKIECEYLTKYVNNRKKYLQEVMDTYGVDRDQAKQLFIRLAYFGTFEAWKDDCNIDSEVNIKFVKRYTQELQNIGTKVVNANPDLMKKIKKLSKDNEMASLVSTVLQEYEKRILECIFNHLLLKKVISNNAVLCFDGIMIPKANYDAKLLAELSKVVSDEMKFNVNFSAKEMNEDYDIKDIVNEDSLNIKQNSLKRHIVKL